MWCVICFAAICVACSVVAFDEDCCGRCCSLLFGVCCYMIVVCCESRGVSRDVYGLCCVVFILFGMSVVLVCLAD